MHARQVAFQSSAFVHFEAISPEVFRKCDLSSIERLRRSFLRAQFKALALDADRRMNNSAAILQGALAGNLVKNIIATRIAVLCRDRSYDREHEKADSSDRGHKILHGRRCRFNRP